MLPSFEPLAMLTISTRYLDLSCKLGTIFVRKCIRADLQPADKSHDSVFNLFESSIPTLFIYFHGIETCLKGHLLGQGITKFSGSGHDLASLLDAMPNKKYNWKLKKLARESLRVRRGTPMYFFLKRNGLSLTNWYQLFKYPTNHHKTKATKLIRHTDLQYSFGEHTGIYWESVVTTSRSLAFESTDLAVKLGYG